MQIETLRTLVKNPDPRSLALSRVNCHRKGLHSVVLAGQPGNLTRVFLAEEEIPPGAIALHNHRQGIEITALTPGIWHQMAYRGAHQPSAVMLPRYLYRSRLSGQSEELRPGGMDFLSLVTSTIPPGATASLAYKDIHTMWCPPGSAWVVRELGLETPQTAFWGPRFSTQGLYEPMPSSLQQAALSDIADLLDRLG